MKKLPKLLPTLKKPKSRKPIDDRNHRNYDIAKYDDKRQHVPVLIYGPADFLDYKKFRRKCDKYLSRFDFIQTLVARDQKTDMKGKEIILDGHPRTSYGIGTFADHWGIGLSHNSRNQSPPVRRVAHLFGSPKKSGMKGTVEQAKEMLRTAKECSDRKPFALIFNDGSKPVKKFIKMVEKRNIKRVIVKV